jgi:hypothetical protein
MRDEKPEDLRPRTKRFALDVIRLYATLPKSTEAQVLGRQVLRSGTSVEESFLRHRAHFSAKRNGGAKPMKDGEWGDLFTARQLRVDIVGFPAPA